MKISIQKTKHNSIRFTVLERKYVGVNCGIMDQFAIANGKQTSGNFTELRNLEYEYIPAEFKEYQLVIINSNKARALAESKYNERRKECDAAYELLSKFDKRNRFMSCTRNFISLFRR